MNCELSATDKAGIILQDAVMSADFWIVMFRFVKKLIAAIRDDALKSLTCGYILFFQPDDTRYLYYLYVIFLPWECIDNSYFIKKNNLLIKYRLVAGWAS